MRENIVHLFAGQTDVYPRQLLSFMTADMAEGSSAVFTLVCDSSGQIVIDAQAASIVAEGGGASHYAAFVSWPDTSSFEGLYYGQFSVLLPGGAKHVTSRFPVFFSKLFDPFTGGPEPGNVLALPRDPETGYPLLKISRAGTPEKIVWYEPSDLSGASNFYIDIVREKTGAPAGSIPASAAFDPGGRVWMIVFKKWADLARLKGRFLLRPFCLTVTGAGRRINPPVVLDIET